MTFARTSLMTSSTPRLRFAFSLTAMSPVFGSVTAARPSSRPVRRDVLSTSGVARRICLDVAEHAVGFLQRAAGRHHVVEDEAAFVERRQQIAAERRDSTHTKRDEQTTHSTRQQRRGCCSDAAHRALVDREHAAEQAAGERRLFGRHHAPHLRGLRIGRRSPRGSGCAASCGCVAGAVRRLPRRIRRVLRLLVQTSASTSDVSSDTLIAIASALKKVPVTPVIVMSGRNTTIGVSVEPISGTVSSLSALAVACSGPFAAVAVQHDVLDDDDLVVDHQADRRRQPAERHQVEALAEHLHRDERHDHRHRHDEAGHDRRAPVAQEQPDDQPGEEQADDDRVADAGDRLR